MIITETRDEGAMIKGVIKLSGQDEISKHFTGNLRVEEIEDSHVRGLFNMVTVAFEGETSQEGLPAFFNPGTIMRLRFKTDGYQLEGDSRALSMRLVRAM